VLRLPSGKSRGRGIGPQLSALFPPGPRRATGGPRSACTSRLARRTLCRRARAVGGNRCVCSPNIRLQFRSIQARIHELDEQAAAASASSQGGWKKKPRWASDRFLVLLLTKGKFLLLGLTKMGTLLTMLASLGVYWGALRMGLRAGPPHLDLHPRNGPTSPPSGEIRVPSQRPRCSSPGIRRIHPVARNQGAAHSDSRIGLAGPHLRSRNRARPLWSSTSRPRGQHLGRHRALRRGQSTCST